MGRLVNQLAAAALGAAATIIVAILAWWRFWPKDRADVRGTDATTEKTLTDIARGLLDEQREMFVDRILHLEGRIAELERQVDELRSLEPEVAELRQKVRVLTDERNAYRMWAKSLEKQVRELGGHPVPLARWLNGGTDGSA